MNNKLHYKIRLTVAILVGILSVLGILGIFYPVKIFDIQLLALMQRVFIDFSIIAAFLLALVLVLTAIYGRLYCSILCPLGILQEVSTYIFRRKHIRQKSFRAKYVVAPIVFGVLFGGSAAAAKYLDPYTLFGSAVTYSALGLIMLLLIFAMVFFWGRVFCTNICPAGTLLGVISKFSPNKIHINQDECTSCAACEKACQSGCIDAQEKTVNNETCVKCLKCLSKCPKGGIKYGLKPKEPVKFSPKRRQIIWAASAIALFGIVAKAGAKIKNKFTDVILPPGAHSEEKFINACLNCNLCIKHCPEKIIKKADGDYGAVHLDYSRGFCRYDCNKCCEVCPSGAIKRIALSEKQKTRIAIAVIDSKTCTKCRTCAPKCPTGAIGLGKNGASKVKSSKCIGCGTCKNYCPNGAIKLFATKEQMRI